MKAPPEPVPSGDDADGLSIFARGYDADNVVISPKGTHLAVTSTKDGHSGVAFLETATMKVVGGHRLGGSEAILSIDWARETRMVMAIGERAGPLAPIRFYGDIVGIDINGKNLRAIFGFRAGETQTGSRVRKARSHQAWGSLIDPLPNDEKYVLIRSRPWAVEIEERTTSVYRVNVDTGVERRLLMGPGHALYYVTDETGEVRAALTAVEDGHVQPYFLDESGAWKSVGDATALTDDARPFGFSAHRNELYVVDTSADGAHTLFALTLGEAEASAMSSSMEVEPSEVLTHPETGVPVAVRYEPDYSEWSVIQSEDPWGQLAQHLAETFKGQRVSIRSRTADGRTLVVLVSSDVNPGVFYLVDTATRKTTPLLRRREGLDPRQMRPVEAFKIKARDGEVVHGYLTLPRDEAPLPPPLIVMPHGGPHGVRDYWRFDPQVQMFAAQGFAVLQVNFRGSGGYGRRFQQAGYRQWGQAIQNDIIDAIRWAIAEKVADPSRICTYGASFGGYSAVQLAVRAPELIRCAVGVAGVYDLPRLMQDSDLTQKQWSRKLVEDYIGDDVEEQRANSPAHNPDRILAPVLLIHGEEDARAPISQARSLCDALESAGKACSTHFVPKEGHGFRSSANRLRAYRRALAFIRESHEREARPVSTTTSP